MTPLRPPTSIRSLLLLDTTPPVLLGVLEGGLVGLGLALAEKAVGSLKGTLEVTSRWLPEDVDLNQIRFESALQRDDRLDQKRVGVLEVQMHDGHHANAHELALNELAELALIVLHVGSCDRTRLLAASKRSRLDVFQCRKIVLLIDLSLCVEIQGNSVGDATESSVTLVPCAMIG